MVTADRLLRALQRTATRSCCSVDCTLIEEVPWASAIYVGARHVVAVVSPADDSLDAWLATLAEADLAMPGQVSDVVLAAREDRDGVATLRIEALTIEV